MESTYTPRKGSRLLAEVIWIRGGLPDSDSKITIPSAVGCSERSATETT